MTSHSDLRKAAEMAATDLEELIHWHGVRDSDDKLMPAHNQTPEIKSAMESLETLRQALAQPEQEPVAWQDPQYKTLIEPHKAHPDWIPLYATPPKREWVGLTGDEQDVIERMANDSLDAICLTEAKLKEKNT